jgi:hypothetical protein
MIIPTFSLPVFSSIFFRRRALGRRSVGLHPRGGSSLQPIRTAYLARLIQVTVCRTLATLFLIGSAVSIAAF